MKNLLNFFFSFDKLFKEKLIVPFFWLAIIVWGLGFFSFVLDKISLGPLAKFAGFLAGLASVLFALLLIRLVCEIAVAIFRINNNLSPDGGKSELADIDPVAEARKAAELAAARTREATRTVSEKAGEATKSLRENAAEMSENVQGKAKAASASVREKASDLKSKAKTPKPQTKPKPKPAAKPKPIKTTANEGPKKRGRPKGSTNKAKSTASKTVTKTKTTKKRGRPVGSKNKTPSAKKATTGKKRGPKPGRKIPRDKDGNLLKKDGTPRKKPGPKT